MHGLEDGAGEFLPLGRLVGPVGAGVETLAHGQADRRRAEPRAAGLHVLVLGRLRFDADQRAGRDVGTDGHHRIIADEDARAGAHLAQGHPAAPRILVAQHHFVGDETFLADLDEIVAARQIGGDFRVLADLRAHQAIPIAHVDGGVERRQGFQRHFGGERHGPFAEIVAGMHRIAAFAHARQDDPAEERD